MSRTSASRDIRVLTEDQLRAGVPLDLAAIDVVEHAFASLASGKVVMPPVLSMEIEEANGEVDIKTAYIPGFESFAVKVSPGFFNNAALGLPSLNGLMVVLSARTGLVEALLLDNGYLTDIRTAAAGAVAARHLAPEVEIAGVLGAGVQAKLQIQASHLVRPFGRVLVWARDPDKARACAEDISEAIGVDARPAATAEEVVRASQLVVTATPAREPILKADWLHPRLHITAMGSDQDGKSELEPTALGRADLYVADRTSQCLTLGELRSAVQASLLDPGDVPELSSVVTGAIPARTHEEQITIADLTGTGAQDTAIANHALAVVGDAGWTIKT